jgi:hypothetical protein
MGLLSRKTGKDLDKLAARDPNAAHALALLDRDIPAFSRVKGFSTRYGRAFKQAVSQESFEVIADFRAEMEVGRLFLAAGLLERFEAPLPVPVSSGEKPPDSDLLVTVNGERIWVEVKRIRRTRAEGAFQKQIKEIAEKIRAIPSPFCVGLSLNSSRLQPPAVDRIVEEIAKTLAAVKTEEPHVDEQPIWLNDNGKETRIGTFSVSPKGKYSPDEATAFSYFTYPPYLEGGGEQKKFLDDLIEKGARLQKLPDNEAGFIFFWVDSGTHEEIDLLGLLEGRLYGSGDSLQGWSRWQIDEFFREYQKVTGVIIRAEYMIAFVPSPGSISWGPEDQKRYEIHWNPWNSWAVNEHNKVTTAMLEDLLS